MISSIYGNIYIGDWQDAARADPNEFIRVTCAFDSPFRGEYVYHLVDGPSEDNELELPLAVDKVVELLEQEKKILVHCVSGRSRSVAVVIGALVKFLKWDLLYTLRFVDKQKPESDPKWSLLRIIDRVR